MAQSNLSPCCGGTAHDSLNCELLYFRKALLHRLTPTTAATVWFGPVWLVAE